MRLINLAIFVSAHAPSSVAKSVSDIRAKAAGLGRDQNIKFLAKFAPVLGRTQEEAEAKYRDYIQYGSYEGALALFGGWTGVDMAPYGKLKAVCSSTSRLAPADLPLSSLRRRRRIEICRE